MTDDKDKTVEELRAKLENLESLKDAIQARLDNASEAVKLEVEALSKRAINPQCSFDRRHREELYALALFPDQASWFFKLRERIHRMVHHH